MQMFVRPVLQRRKIIRADTNYLTLHIIEFCDTRLVRGEFLRSTTGERGRKKRNDNVLLAAVVRQFEVLARGGRKLEIRRGVADLEVRFGRRDRALSRDQASGRES